MKWHLSVETARKPSFRKIGYSDRLLSAGSCFSEHLGRDLADHRFRIISNPFGILYNPASVGRSLDRIADGKLYSHDHLVGHGGLWHSPDHHGVFSGPDAGKVVAAMNDALAEAHQHWTATGTALITFGTAWTFLERASGRVVGNCHKRPSSDFIRHRMTIDQIVQDWSARIEQHPGVQWIFTVSPVRHWKDGAADNSWSKSILICAVRELESAFDSVHYFPAYEILMDELRDYRFYASDLRHPNAQAVKYVRERFAEWGFDESAARGYDRADIILRRLAHRPLHSGSDELHRFNEETRHMISVFEKTWPGRGWKI